MRKIAGPGHSSNEFADYDAATNPNGTVVTAQWANDVQREFIAKQVDAGIAEADGSNAYIMASDIYRTIKYSKRVGELYYADDYEAPSAFDKDNPEDYHPGLCLNTITDYTDIAVANWSELVPHLRARPAYYQRGKAGEKYQFDVTDWDVTTNVGTITFANTTAENAILAAMAEDNLVHGSYSNWRTVTLASAIGNIPAGDYAITDVDTTARTIEFAVTASDGSGSVTATASFYPHRVAGSTTTARVFEASDRAIMSEAEDGSVISGLRHRDAMQRITGTLDTEAGGTFASVKGGSGVFSVSNATNVTGSSTADTGYRDTSFNSADSTSPNAAKTHDEKTRPKAIGAFLYIHGRSYAA